MHFPNTKYFCQIDSEIQYLMRLMVDSDLIGKNTNLKSETFNVQKL